MSPTACKRLDNVWSIIKSTTKIHLDYPQNLLETVRTQALTRNTDHLQMSIKTGSNFEANVKNIYGHAEHTTRSKRN